MGSQIFAVSPRDDSSSQQNAIIDLIAPFYLGIVVNYLLWGVQITQSYYYYKTYRETDRLWLKLAVGLIFITDAVESISVTQVGWRFMVEGWGDLNGVSLHPGWGLSATPFMDTFTASIVHCFYAQKIWTLLDAPYNTICTAVVVCFSALQLAAGIGCTAFMFTIQITIPEFDRIKTWGIIWLVTAAVTDVVITALMTGKLSKSRTGFKRTDDIISKLIRLTVETGLATAVVQIVDIIIYLIWPLKPYHIVPAFIGPKVYSNSMLALLNSRSPRTSPNMMWASSQISQDKPVDGIHIHTTQTVDVTRDFEMNDTIKRNGSRPRLTSNHQTPPETESFNSLSGKSPDFMVA